MSNRRPFSSDERPDVTLLNSVCVINWLEREITLGPFFGFSQFGSKRKIHYIKLKQIINLFTHKGSPLICHEVLSVWTEAKSFYRLPVK